MCFDLCASELISELLSYFDFFRLFVWYFCHLCWVTPLNHRWLVIIYRPKQFHVSIIIAVWTLKRIFLSLLIPRSQIWEKPKNYKRQRPHSFFFSALHLQLFKDDKYVEDHWFTSYFLLPDVERSMFQE